jgi:hypothetical protein
MAVLFRLPSGQNLIESKEKTMPEKMSVSPFWWRWMVVVTIGVIVYGLALLVAPGPMQDIYNRVFYSDRDIATVFSSEASHFVRFVYRVLGAVMVGWMITVLGIVIVPFRRGERWTWTTLTLSIGAWFVLDSAFSMADGFVMNAVFNVAFLVLFAIPLTAIYRSGATAKAKLVETMR